MLSLSVFTLRPLPWSKRCVGVIEVLVFIRCTATSARSQRGSSLPRSRRNRRTRSSVRSCPRWTRRINWSNRFKCWRMSTRMSKKRVNHFVSKWPGRNSKASLPSLKPLTLPLSQSCFWIHSLFCAWMCYVTSGQSYKHSMIVIYNYRVVLEANV